MIRRRLLTTLVLLCVAGCATAKKAYHRASSDLVEAVGEYNIGLRTGEIERSVPYIPTADRPAFFDAWSKMSKERRITDARVAATEFPEGGSEATVTVARSYYMLNELTEKQETINQTWLWDVKRLRWQLKWEGKP